MPDTTQNLADVIVEMASTIKQLVDAPPSGGGLTSEELATALKPITDDLTDFGTRLDTIADNSAGVDPTILSTLVADVAAIKAMLTPTTGGTIPPPPVIDEPPVDLSDPTDLSQPGVL
jgi:hypothetical protein